MSISLSQAISNINRCYNKPEMNQYLFLAVLFPLIILLIFGCLVFGIMKASASASDSVGGSQILMMVLSMILLYIIVFIISIVISILVNGIYIKALHNSITGQSKIFPSISEEFGSVVKTGAIYLGCTIIASVACSMINQMLSFIAAPFFAAAKNSDVQTASIILTIVGVFVSAIYLLPVVFTWLMMISFSRKLKFEQYFDFKWCWKLLTKRVKELTMLGVYNILLFIPVILVIIGLCIYSFPLIKNMNLNQPSIEVITPFFTVLAIAVVLVSLYYFYIQIINIDLISQIIGKRRNIDKFNSL